MADGEKKDGGKLRWGLLPWHALKVVVEVLEFGAKKYSPDNWKRVTDAQARYKEALGRHVAEFMMGHWRDGESGLPVLGHVVCNALYLLWFDQTDQRATTLARAMGKLPLFDK